MLAGIKFLRVLIFKNPNLGTQKLNIQKIQFEILYLCIIHDAKRKGF